MNLKDILTEEEKSDTLHEIKAALEKKGKKVKTDGRSRIVFDLMPRVKLYAYETPEGDKYWGDVENSFREEFFLNFTDLWKQVMDLKKLWSKKQVSRDINLR